MLASFFLYSGNDVQLTQLFRIFCCVKFQSFVGEDNFHWGGSCYVVGLNEKALKEANVMTEGHCIIRFGSRGCCKPPASSRYRSFEGPGGEALGGLKIPTFYVTRKQAKTQHFLIVLHYKNTFSELCSNFFFEKISCKRIRTFPFFRNCQNFSRQTEFYDICRAYIQEADEPGRKSGGNTFIHSWKERSNTAIHSWKERESTVIHSWKERE